MSIQAANSSSPKDAVLLSESALTAAPHLTPVVEGSLHLRLAAAAASVGDAATWERDLDPQVLTIAPAWCYII